jgi:D-alanine transaminase
MSVYPIIMSQSKFVHRDSLSYPYEERGMQFGDGVYEVIRIYNGNYYLLEAHVNRLFRSAEAIKITLSFTKEKLTDLLLKLKEKNGITGDGKVYLQVTRGSAPREHVFPVQQNPNVYAYLQDLPRPDAKLKDGVRAITEKDVRWDYCYIKSLNLLPNVLAKQAAAEKNCHEAILHKDGLVTECSSSNIFLVQGEKIYTFPATKRILHGCVRERVKQFSADLNLTLIEEGFRTEDIPLADELFITSTTSEIMPIIEVDGKIIADGKPGKITKQLQKAYETDANITR